MASTFNVTNLVIVVGRNGSKRLEKGHLVIKMLSRNTETVLGDICKISCRS